MDPVALFFPESTCFASCLLQAVTAVVCDEQELITSILLSCHKIKAQFASPGLFFSEKRSHDRLDPILLRRK
jgi:hypothetical protein